MGLCELFAQQFLCASVKNGIITEASENFLTSFNLSLNDPLEKIISHELQQKSSDKFLHKGKSYSFKKILDQNHSLFLLEDISHLRLEAENLKKGQETLLEAQAIAHLGSWDWNIQTGSLTWSDEIYRIFGLQPQEFGATYEAFLSYIHPKDQQLVIDAVNKSVAEKAPYQIEHRVLWQNGLIRHVLEHGRVYYDENGTALRMIGVVHDITERKLYEKTLQDMNAVLEQKVQERTYELRDSHERMLSQAKLASVGTLTAGIAHEIRNPLNIIKGSIYIAEKFLKEYPLESITKSEKFSELGEYFQEDLTTVIKSTINQNENINRINTVITNMMDMIQDNEGALDYNVSINDIIVESSKLAFKAAEFKKIPKIIYKLDSKNPLLTVNKNEIARVIINLIENAFYAMQENAEPELVLSTYLVSDKIVEIVVKDNGSGMPKSILDRIFEPFYTTKPTNVGTGLGLFLCYNIIRKHGGHISVNSELGKGTSFTVELRGKK